MWINICKNTSNPYWVLLHNSLHNTYLLTMITDIKQFIYMDMISKISIMYFSSTSDEVG